MEKELILHSFINVFNVTPTFLLPIFADSDKVMFQKIENDIISSFVDAELRKFDECRTYPVKDNKKTYSPGAEAIYAIDLPNEECIYGNRNDIEKYYSENIEIFNNYPDFCEYMLSFIATKPKLEKSFNDKYSFISLYVELIRIGDTAKRIQNKGFKSLVEPERIAV